MIGTAQKANTLKLETERFSEIETPFYFYDIGLLKETIQQALAASARHDFHIHYALKANANPGILKCFVEAGIGADCVSGNEVSFALESGFSPDQVVFAGVGKSDKEIRRALEQKIFCFNCESLQELEVINELALEMNTVAPVALRINPNVNAFTHHYITTGLEENKFGINPWQLEEVVEILKRSPGLKLQGLHFHIGSQIQDMSAFKNLCIRVNELSEWFSNRNIEIAHLNMGGGLGIDYHQPDNAAIPDFEAYFSVFSRFLERKPGQQVHFELGRSLVGQCGTLISRVLYVKPGVNTSFLILDAGMTELIRPALYQAYHKIENLSKSGEKDASMVNLEGNLVPAEDPGNLKKEGHGAMLLKYDVVGPVCESSDCFGKAMLLPATGRGDLIAIRSAGAYGEIMSSSYNLRDRVRVVFSE